MRIVNLDLDEDFLKRFFDLIKEPFIYLRCL